ncbi:MAG: ABC transporter substrate-binding protein [Polyangiaceae bacterium]
MIAGGPIGEIVFALGAGDRVVGADTSCTFPEAFEKLPRVGYQRKLSAEGVLSLRPSLLLAGHESGPPEALAQIEGAGVVVARFAEALSVAAAVASVREVGAAVGRAAEATALARGMEREITSAREEIARSSSRARALFLYARGPGTVLAGGAGTAAAAMIDLAGAVNAAADIEGFRPITAESVIAARPEVIVIPERGLQSLGGAPGLFALPGIAATSAAASRRVVSLDDQLLLGFGPRLATALRALAEGIRAASPVAR